MDYRLICILVICIIATTFAMPSEASRERRDVMDSVKDSVKNAWGDMVKTLSDAGDAVVHVFKPTEKSTIDKMADGIKSLTQ